jgi:hypothetical protein
LRDLNKARETLMSIRLAVVSLSVLFTSVPGVCAASEAKINRETRAALGQLYSLSPAARQLGALAKAVLVFPSIARTNPNTGAQHVYGTLLANGQAIGYYKLVGSYSVPAGVQKFGYGLFFMSDGALAQMRNSGGREIRTGPGGVVAEENQKTTQQSAASTTVNTNADESIGTRSSTAGTASHSSQITHRPAMNDQQEAAPRPNDLMLGPTYGGFAPAPNMSLPRGPTTTTPRKGVYVFAFTDTGLITGLTLAGTKIVAMKTTESQ